MLIWVKLCSKCSWIKSLRLWESLLLLLFFFGLVFGCIPIVQFFTCFFKARWDFANRVRICHQNIESADFSVDVCCSDFNLHFFGPARHFWVPSITLPALSGFVFFEFVICTCTVLGRLNLYPVLHWCIYSVQDFSELGKKTFVKPSLNFFSIFSFAITYLTDRAYTLRYITGT